MTSVWRSLLWKEWREHRWKLAALAALSLVVPALFSVTTPGLIYGHILFTLFITVPLGAMFVGMSAAAGEQSRGTIRFLQALPTPMAKPATAKLFWAAVTVACPVAAAVAGAAFWEQFVLGPGHTDEIVLGQRWHDHIWGFSDWYASTLAAGVLGGVSIMLWMAAAGVNLSDEVRAGAVGLLVALSIWAALLLPLTFGAWRYENNQWTTPTWYAIGSAAAPGGPASVTNPSWRAATNSWRLEFGPPMAAAVVSHVVVAGWYLRRFGRTPPGPPQLVESQPAKAELAWLPPPRRSPLTAIVWKQMRESAPLALLGAGVIVLTGTWTAVANWDRNLAHSVASVTSGVWRVMGMFVAIVAGIGTFMDDLRPGLNGFWRSRPINVNQWFAVKFSLSLVTTLAILAIPPLTVTAYFWTPLANASLPRAAQVANLEMGLLIQAVLFTAAVAAITLVRQAIYAAVASVALVVAVSAIISLVDPTWLVGLAAYGVSALACLTIAWAAVRNDWGWKG